VNPAGLLHERCERSTNEAIEASAGKPGKNIGEQWATACDSTGEPL
jgi:hypothetical protein